MTVGNIEALMPREITNKIESKYKNINAGKFLVFLSFYSKIALKMDIAPKALSLNKNTKSCL